MTYIIVKSLHIIGVVSWFAGLFYIVRLFIYQAEADSAAEPRRSILRAQFSLMARRLWRAITVPAMVVTAITGGWLISYFPLSVSPWLYLKFGLLVLLFGYHFYCGYVRARMEAGERPHTSHQLRIINEIPTFLLVAIVFTVVSKSVATGLWSLVGCALFFVVLVTFFLRKLQGKS